MASYKSFHTLHWMKTQTLFASKEKKTLYKSTFFGNFSANIFSSNVQKKTLNQIWKCKRKKNKKDSLLVLCIGAKVLWWPCTKPAERIANKKKCDKKAWKTSPKKVT